MRNKSRSGKFKVKPNNHRQEPIRLINSNAVIDERLRKAAVRNPPPKKPVESLSDMRFRKRKERDAQNTQSTYVGESRKFKVPFHDEKLSGMAVPIFLKNFEVNTTELSALRRAFNKVANSGLEINRLAEKIANETGLSLKKALHYCQWKLANTRR